MSDFYLRMDKVVISYAVALSNSSKLNQNLIDSNFYNYTSSATKMTQYWRELLVLLHQTRLPNSVGFETIIKTIKKM